MKNLRLFIQMFYYQNFKFYSRVWKESDPHFTTKLALSFYFTVSCILIFDIISITLNCGTMGKALYFTIWILATILCFNYFRKIHQLSEFEHTKFFQNKFFDQLIVATIDIFCISILFWLPFAIPVIIKKTCT